MAKDVKLDLHQYADKFAVHMVTELFRHMEAQRKLRGDDFGAMLPGAFLSRFIGALLFRTLKASITATTEEGAMNQALHNYASVKLDIQESVAHGFQTAMTLHSGVPNEYFCHIKVVPPPTTKASN